MALQTLVGWEKMKALIQPKRAASSHRRKSPTNKSTWLPLMQIWRSLRRRRYSRCSGEKALLVMDIYLLPNGGEILTKRGMLPGLEGRKPKVLQFNFVYAAYPAGPRGENNYPIR